MSLLVSYSDSGSEGEEESKSIPEQNFKKMKTEHGTCEKKKHLPLPDSIKTLFGQDSDCKEDPTQHDGRIRSFAHEKGNWATSVYIPYEPDDHITDMIGELLLCLRPLDFHVMENLHVSLSRTVSIRHHWIQSLVDALRSKITPLSSFPCEMTGLRFYVNDEKTRTFLAVEVASPSNELVEYTGVVDKCFKEFNLQTYYKEPSFHISIAWCLGDVVSKIPQKKMEELKSIWKSTCEDSPEMKYFYVKSVHCKTGNKQFEFKVDDT